MLDFLYSQTAFALAIVISLGLFYWCGLCLVPAYMARQRGRSFWGWFFLSILLLSCLGGIVFLAALGETDEHRKKRIIEEERWRRGLA